MTIARTLMLFAALTITSLNTGCVALLDAGIKETADHGHNARYENKSYGEHFLDSLFEDDDDDCHCTTVVHHCH